VGSGGGVKSSRAARRARCARAPAGPGDGVGATRPPTFGRPVRNPHTVATGGAGRLALRSGPLRANGVLSGLHVGGTRRSARFAARALCAARAPVNGRRPAHRCAGPRHRGSWQATQHHLRRRDRGHERARLRIDLPTRQRAGLHPATMRDGERVRPSPSTSDDATKASTPTGSRPVSTPIEGFSPAVCAATQSVLPFSIRSASADEIRRPRELQSAVLGNSRAHASPGRT